MSDGRSMDVFVVVGARGGAKEADHRFLADAVARVAGVDRRSVRIEQRCEVCGGPHGRPVVVQPAGLTTGRLHISLARAGHCVAVAVTFAGPVGIDIESIEAVSRAAFDDVAFGAAEQAALRGVVEADAAWTRAAMWTGKESVLKAQGVGLRVDPRELSVSVPSRDRSGPLFLNAWPGAGFPLGGMRLECFEPRPGLVGTVALLAARHPRVRLIDTAVTGSDAFAPGEAGSFRGWAGGSPESSGR